MKTIDNSKDAVTFMRRFTSLLMRGLLSVLLGNRKGYRRFSKEFAALFPEVTPEEETAAEEATPLNLRWWRAEARAASAVEQEIVCLTCKEEMGDSLVKECPNCHVIMHAACYDKPYGGSYQTEDCEACRHRCYSR